MKSILTMPLLLMGTLLFAQMPNTLSNAEKVYGLSKFWQEVNYNFIYLDKVDREMWDAEYVKLIDEVQKTGNDYEYFRLLQRFCALLNDGHTNINFPEAIQNKIFTTYFGDYRLFITNIDGKAIITRINPSKKEEVPVGTEIISVNGLSTQEHITQNVRPYISSSTKHILEDNSIFKMLESPKGTTYNLGLKLPDGTQKSLTVTHEEVTEKEVYPPFEKQALLTFKWYENDIAYVALNSFSDPKIIELFQEQYPELKKAKKLIVDIRNNGGGSTNIGGAILAHLTNDKVLYGSKNQSRLHIPSFKAWGGFTEAKDTIGNEWNTKAFLSYHDQYYHDFPYNPGNNPLSEDAPRFVVPTVILIGHQTGSAAEDMLIYADNQKHMTKIGEPTFGSTGQPFHFKLPGGGTARVCTKKDTYPDGREFVGYGVQPDILVKKTVEDYMADRDPALEKAIAFLQKK